VYGVCAVLYIVICAIIKHKCKALVMLNPRVISKINRNI
jgi:hypothetical protein